MTRIIPIALLLCLFTSAARAQPQTPAPSPRKLTLTAPKEVAFTPGKLLTVTASGAAKVTWELFTTPEVELDYTQNGNTLIMAYPPAGTTVYVIAAAVVGDGPALAKTTITVTDDGKAAKKPGAGDKAGTAAPVTGKVKYATVVYDQQTAEVKALLAKRADLEAACKARGVKLSILDAASDDAKSLGFDGLPAQTKGPCIALQNANGVLLDGAAYPLKTGDADPSEGIILLIEETNKAGK